MLRITTDKGDQVREVFTALQLACLDFLDPRDNCYRACLKYLDRLNKMLSKQKQYAELS
jgi:hypothetical protein